MAAATAPGTADPRAGVRREPRTVRATGPAAGITPADIRADRGDLGRQLAAWRDAAGVTQVDLARRTCYSRSTIANVETGRQNIPRAFWLQADRELGADGLLVKAFEQVDALVLDYNEQVARAREQERHQRAARHAPASEPDLSAGTAPDMCGCGLTVARWGGREARALREAMRLPVRAFAEYLGVAVSTVSGWENKRVAKPLHLSTQDVLDQALKLADVDVRDRFWQLIDSADDDAPSRGGSSSSGGAWIYSISRRRVGR